MPKPTAKAQLRDRQRQAVPQTSVDPSNAAASITPHLLSDPTIASASTILAYAPKSNAAYMAINAAMDDIKNGRVLPVPIYLQDPNTSPRASADGSGQRVRDLEDEKYQYSHNAEDQLTGQDYLGVDKRYYEPRDIGSEKILRAFLENARAKKSERNQDR